MHSFDERVSNMALIVRNPSLEIPRIEKDNIKKVIFDDCTLTESDVDALEKALARTKSVKVFYLFRNRFSRGYVGCGSRSIARGLAANKSIEQLHLCCQVGISTILSEALPQNQTITELHLWNNDATLKYDEVMKVAEYISLNRHLVKLVLPRNGFSTREGEVFLKTADNHVSIKEIDLSFNKIDSKICNTLAKTTNLSVVSLAGNPLGDESSIAEALEQNTKIRELDLSSCRMVDLTDIIRACRKNTHLVKLNVGRNSIIDAEGLRKLSKQSDQCIERGNAENIIDHYLKWNKCGRYMLQTHLNIKNEGIWSLVLEKVAKQPSILYEYVKANPHLIHMRT